MPYVSLSPFTNSSLSIITSAALVDSINPSAIALLLILLSILLAHHNKRGALRVGCAFIGALYITYLLIGVAIINALTLSNATIIMQKIIGFIIVIVGLLSIKDFFWYHETAVIDEVPRAWRPTLQHTLKNPTPLTASIIGILVALFEFPFTGGSYAFVLGLLAQGTSWTHTLTILAYYNFIFVLPLIILATLLYFGITTAQKLTQWEIDHVRILHLIAGVILLMLGAWILVH